MATEEKKPTGSPTTAATPGATKNTDAQNDASLGNQSKTSVGGAAAPKPDPDAKPATEDKPDPAPEISREEEAELETILDGKDERDPATTRPTRDSVNKLFRILKAVPEDTPDEHVVWGAAGIQLTFGDLRNLAREID